MEQELNIAAILKDKPKGTKLYDLVHNIEVEFDKISTTNGVTNIWCKRDLPNKTQHFGYSELGTERGWLEGMQILKPSKEMQDWSKFAWKKGDVLIDENGCRGIFDSFSNEDYTSFGIKYYYSSDLRSLKSCSTNMPTHSFKKVNKDANTDFIKKLEGFYGGKLNLKTLCIEKSEPQFKDGDIVVLDKDDTFAKTISIIKKLYTKFYTVYAFYNASGDFIKLDSSITDSRKNFRLATDSEKQQFFDALAKENKAWNAETKQLEDLPEKCEFELKDWCLMRRGSIDTWHLCQYSDTCTDGYYAVGGNFFKECIPYNEQTAHLLGTTDDWKGGNNG